MPAKPPFDQRAGGRRRQGGWPRAGRGRLAGSDLRPQGRSLYVGGGAQAAVFEFSFSGGKLGPAATFPVVEPAKRDAPRLHRRRRVLAGRASALRGGALPELDRRHQSAVRAESLTGSRPAAAPTASSSIPTARRSSSRAGPTAWCCGTRPRPGTSPARFLLGPHPTDMVWVAGKAQARAGRGDQPVRGADLRYRFQHQQRPRAGRRPRPARYGRPSRSTWP